MSSSNGVSSGGFANSGTANNMSSTYGNRATSAYNVLTPTLNRWASGNTPGMGAQQIANENTATTQSIGGATAGAVGGMNQAAARTNNAGAYAPAAHDATSQLSDAALNVQNQNAQLKQQQQLEGIQGLEGMYGQNVGAQENALGLSDQALGVANAGKQTALAPWLAGIQAAGQVGGAFCPAKGTLYLMADGSTKPVEELEVGDMIAGLGGEPQIVEEIQTGPAAVVRAHTENGFEVRNSYTHAYVRPAGGFVVAGRSLGVMVSTATGPSRIVSLQPDGEDTVYNVITDGSHSYCADGVWALGVGDAERQVPMSAWASIGNRLRDAKEKVTNAIPVGAILGGGGLVHV